MSTSASCDVMMDLHILYLTGEVCTLKLHGSSLGSEVHRMVSEKLLPKKGGKLILHGRDGKLMLHQTLEEQGIIGGATLSGTFVPTDLKAAWCLIE